MYYCPCCSGFFTSANAASANAALNHISGVVSGSLSAIESATANPKAMIDPTIGTHLITTVERSSLEEPIESPYQYGKHRNPKNGNLVCPPPLDSDTD